MVGSQAVALPVRAPAPPFFMVARFTGSASSCITGDAGFYVFIGALLASRPMSDAAAASKTASASVALTLFPKERPLASEAKDWCDDAKPLLPADQRALIDGLTPRALLAYSASTIPAEIPSGEAGAPQREALRLQIEDSNRIKEEQKKSHVSEIKSSLFASLHR